MKYISRIFVCIISLYTFLLSSCIEETFPNSGATEEIIDNSDKGIESKLWAIPAFALNFATVTDAVGYDWGYGSIMHIRDVMTQDMPIYNSPYDHYTPWEANIYIGPNYMCTQFVWTYYYKFVQTTNKLLQAIPENTKDEKLLGYRSVALAYRAFLYLEMAQMYEFLPNDGTDNVNIDGNDVTNLTVPIVKEDITEEQSRNNPRVSREVMSEFILGDLNKAEEHIDKLVDYNKTLPNLAVIYGIKARYYMWLANYGEAKKYARKAIDESGCTPLTREQWLNPTSGFNDIASQSWMWGAKAQQENATVQSGILNWVSWMSNEARFGYAVAGPVSMIDKSLYDQISNKDFRKLSWQPPVGHELDGQINYIDPEFGKTLPNYTSFKFRPGNGDVNDYNVGAAVAIPMMRVEEMYLIEAEAAAHQNKDEGKQLIESFMKNYRYSDYSCPSNSQNGVINEILLQKRIELWGEGQTFFDIKRLDYPVVRGYEGSNFSSSTQFNTKGRPAWMNFCIVIIEENNNSALVGFNNPDPSGCYVPYSSLN